MKDEFAPVTPGELLKEEFLGEYGLSQNQLAKAIGIFLAAAVPEGLFSPPLPSTLSSRSCYPLLFRLSHDIYHPFMSPPAQDWRLWWRR